MRRGNRTQLLSIMYLLINYFFGPTSENLPQSIEDDLARSFCNGLPTTMIANSTINAVTGERILVN